MDSSSEAGTVIITAFAVILAAALGGAIALGTSRGERNHARKLADLGELRVLLDEAAILAGNASRLAARVYRQATGAPGSGDATAAELMHELLERPGGHLVDPADFRMGPPEVDPGNAAGSPGALYEMLQRISLRLPPEDPVSTRFREVWEALEEFVKAVQADYDTVERDRLNERRQAVARAAGAFLDAARRRVGTEVPDDGHEEGGPLAWLQPILRR